VNCFTVAVCTTIQGVLAVHDWYYWEHLCWIVGHLSTEDKNSASLITETSCIRVSCVYYIYRTFLFSAEFHMTIDSLQQESFNAGYLNVVALEQLLIIQNQNCKHQLQCKIQQSRCGNSEHCSFLSWDSKQCLKFRDALEEPAASNLWEEAPFSLEDAGSRFPPKYWSYHTNPITSKKTILINNDARFRSLLLRTNSGYCILYGSANFLHHHHHHH
jgi:hypothetical protein